MALKITKLAKNIFITDDDIHFAISTTKNITPENIDTYRKEGQSREDAYICLLKDIMQIISKKDIHIIQFGLISKDTEYIRITKDDEIIGYGKK